MLNAKEDRLELRVSMSFRAGVSHTQLEPTGNTRETLTCPKFHVPFSTLRYHDFFYLPTFHQSSATSFTHSRNAAVHACIWGLHSQQVLSLQALLRLVIQPVRGAQSQELAQLPHNQCIFIYLCHSSVL
jgi:hypothetical protein